MMFTELEVNLALQKYKYLVYMCVCVIIVEYVHFVIAFNVIK